MGCEWTTEKIKSGTEGGGKNNFCVAQKKKRTSLQEFVMEEEGDVGGGPLRSEVHAWMLKDRKWGMIEGITALL